ncbi:unnamed protein product [Prorocentrum cordatum]|uniref:Uncharacterized protein n=1 Tax=Prorocentrum cordatum TaxID=2364126 RepID=A0ABN9XA34_9DINO|nr:unnamed protein product [Polarella glacialis]
MTKVRKPQTMKTHFCAPFSLTMLAMLIASSETSQRHDTYVHCAQHGQGRFLSHSAQRTHEHQNIYRRVHSAPRPTASNCRAQATGPPPPPNYTSGGGGGEGRSTLRGSTHPRPQLSSARRWSRRPRRAGTRGSRSAARGRPRRRGWCRGRRARSSAPARGCRGRSRRRTGRTRPPRGRRRREGLGPRGPTIFWSRMKPGLSPCRPSLDFPL